MPRISRRAFIRSAAGLGAAALLPACRSSEAPAGTPPVFDYPLVLPLPFAHGVASGDPLSDRVILWTRITEENPGSAGIPVQWTMARDPAMSQVVRSGSQLAEAARDWTVKVDVTGLSPATVYYYRFEALGARSITGRTRTAPAAVVDNLRFAVAACSSYWSSTWSGYGHIADRNDLDLVIHCGDYIYDFIDEDEFIRSRKGIRDLGHPDNRDWLNLDELRRRYALFRSDPNLMRAHQQHPWFIVWDNHDIDEGYGNELATPFDGMQGSTTLEQCCQAFWEWTPSRPVKADGSGEFLLVNDGSYPQPPDVKLLYRRLPYGGLAEVFGVDTQIGLPGHGLSMDASHLAAGNSLFGRKQFEWFSSQLLASQQSGTAWKVVANQTWIAPIGVPPLIPGAEPPQPIEVTRWGDYREEREALFGYLRGANPASLRVRGTVFVSGDAHGNWGSDLIETSAVASAYQSGPPVASTRSGSRPANLNAGFLRAATGNTALQNNRASSVGVEFAPSSLGRGGADEIIQNANPGNPEAANVAGARALEQAVIAGAKNLQFIEWVDHGYGIVDLTAERAIFEYWWQDKLTEASPDVLGFQMVSWAADDAAALPAPRYRDQIDAVTLHGLSVTPTAGTRSAAPAPLDQAVEPR